MDKWHQYLYRKSNITFHTDHQPLETTLLSKAPRRLQSMMLTLQRYQLTVSHKKGKELYVADTLSRAALNDPTSIGVDQAEVFRLELAEIDLKPSQLTADTLQRIRSESNKDSAPAALNEIVINGWPDERKEGPKQRMLYWGYRDEIPAYDGVLFKSHQVIVYFVET